MAGNEVDREDLLREAVALVPRAELEVSGLPERLTVGFRSTGMLSLYFGQDPVYQFDQSGRLRRAFEGGLLYRTAASTLSRLQRVRADNTVTLLRHDLNPDELAVFRSRMQQILRTLQMALETSNVTVVRSVPAEGTNWTRLILDSLSVIHAADPWLAGPIVKRRNR
ncbi:MAG: hypothetical protein ACKO2P_03980 [Planctomycetota bacterium]